MKYVFFWAMLFIVLLAALFMFFTFKSMSAQSKIETKYYRDQMLNACYLANAESELVGIVGSKCNMPLNESLKLNCTALLLHG